MLKEETTTQNKIFERIEIIIFAIFAFLKLTKIYDLVVGSVFAPIYAITSILILITLYIVIDKICNKASGVFLIISYILLSTILMIDSVYFSYNYKLTSVANIKLIGYLDAVKESVNAVNPAKSLWMFIDIPVILIYSLFLRKKMKSKIKLTEKYRYIINALTVCTGIFFVIYSISVDFKIRYLKSENIIYHTIDIFNTILPENREFNYSKYIEEKEIVRDENYGIANGKNVVIIQVEALQAFPIDREYNGQEITPFLNKLKKENSFYFNNYFYQVGSGNTSDAEFVVNNSILPINTEAVYLEYYENDFYGLPHILKDNGYKTANAFHAYEKEFWNRNKAYPKQGFDRYFSNEDFSEEEIIRLGLSDGKFLLEAVDKIKTQSEPWYSFLITLSSHHPFNIEPRYSEIQLLQEHENTMFGGYIRSINYLDKCLEDFFEKMKKEGMYENTMFVIYGDHFGIANYNDESAGFVSELIGHEYNERDMFNVPLLIHIPGMEKVEEKNIVAGHVDVLPTLLHLLGIENNKSIMMGNDLFSINENIVYEQTHVGVGSYIDEDTFYYVSSSGIDIYDKAIDAKTGQKVQITGDMLKKSAEATQTIKDAKTLLERNLIIKNNEKH
ncbi:MAG: LTA synthase family protein [Clostridia bacterium]|nr:LTA synthase family protein [Clostridia bacterium]